MRNVPPRWLLTSLVVCTLACGRQAVPSISEPAAEGDALAADPKGPSSAGAGAATALVIYDDRPENGFVNGSWGVYNMEESTTVYNGNFAMSLQPSNYDGVQLYRATPLSAGAYTAVDFWINGGAHGGQRLWVGVTGTPSGTYRVPVNPYVVGGGPLAPNKWVHVVAPLSAMGASQVAVQSVYVMAALQRAQGTVYVDQVQLDGAGTTTTTGGGTTTTGGGATTTGGGATTTGGGATTTGGGTTTTGGGTTTTGGGTTTTGGGTTTTGGSTTGGTTGGRESWAWVYTDYSSSLTEIQANPQSFTHISPTFYSLNYNYSSGVAYYSNCTTSSGTFNCTNAGTNNFSGYTTQSFTAAVTKLGMKTIPAIYAGSANNGSDTGVQNILNNPTTVGAAFISAMVQEAVTNGYAGYNLDWEMGSVVGSSYATAFVNFVSNFKAALAPHNMILTADAIVSNINGTWCSSNNGYMDFGKLSTSSIDRIIIEDYTSSLGTASTSCQSAPLSSTNPATCPLNSAGNNVTAIGLLNFMCSNLPPGMVVIGLEAYSGGTNAIAGSVMSAIESYGMTKVAVWPQLESTYPFLSSSGLVASQSNWYAVLSSFLSQ